MNAPDPKALARKLEELSPERLAQVEHLVDSLRAAADGSKGVSWPEGFFERAIGSVPDFPEVPSEGSFEARASF